MKRKMAAMLLGMALAAGILGGCGEATIGESSAEAVGEAEGEAGEENIETEEEEATQEEVPDETEEGAPDKTEEETFDETEEEDPDEMEKETSDETEEEASDQTEEETAGEETGEETAETTETAEAEETIEETAYTYSEVSATMYAKQSVNVRDIPSSSGNRVGGLSANEEVVVTGQCNETGWYRISYNGTDAYVSSSYLVSEEVQTQTATTDTTQDITTTTQTEDTAATQTKDTSIAQTEDAASTAQQVASTATQESDSTSTSSQGTTAYTLPQYFDNYADAYDAGIYWQTVMNVKVIIDTTRTDGLYAVLDYNTVMGTSITDSESASTTTTQENYFVDTSGFLSLINAARVEAGVNELTWNESLADLANTRAQEIVTNFDHQRPDGTYTAYYYDMGEDCAYNYSTSVQTVFNQWMEDEPHKASLLWSTHTSCYLSGYDVNGCVYWVLLLD